MPFCWSNLSKAFTFLWLALMQLQIDLWQFVRLIGRVRGKDRITESLMAPAWQSATRTSFAQTASGKPDAEARSAPH